MFARLLGALSLRRRTRQRPQAWSLTREYLTQVAERDRIVRMLEAELDGAAHGAELGLRAAIRAIEQGQ